MQLYEVELFRNPYGDKPAYKERFTNFVSIENANLYISDRGNIDRHMNDIPETEYWWIISEQKVFETPF